MATGALISSATQQGYRGKVRTRRKDARARPTLDERTASWYARRVTKRVLIVGSGAREHALAKAIASAGADVWIAPGNAGTAARGRNAAVRSDDVDGLVALALRVAVTLVVVGPELPLTLGLVDALAAKGVLAFGPTRAAARLEGSKAFMKRFL